jgi:hypothetical protein
MGWFSYELGRQDGRREERNRNSGGCEPCFWAMVSILTPLGVGGLFRQAWKDFFHVEPPIIADLMVVATVLVLLAIIAVDEYRRKNRVGVARLAKLFGNFSLRRIFLIIVAGIVLVSVLVIAIELAGLGVDSRPPAIAAKNPHSTTPHRAK